MAQSTILLVEDMEEDVEALRRALHKLRASYGLIHCVSAVQARQYLRRTSAAESREPAVRPALILLDLNLPGSDGRSLLRELKQDEGVKDIPVVVFSTSDNPVDVDFCYRHGASGYQVKLMDIEGQMRALQIMLQYWFEVLTLPGAAGRHP
jgi:CheY-like chemotaxis protein